MLSVGLISTGLFSSTVFAPSAVHAANEPTVLAMEPSTENSRASDINIEERFQTDEPVKREYLLSAQAGEAIIVYSEKNDGRPYSVRVSLFDENGQQVPNNYAYVEGVRFDEWSGRHDSFRLPTTGNYRLVFEAGDLDFGEDSAEPSQDHYLLRARVASYLEERIMEVTDAFDDERYDDAIASLEKAIAHDPEHPLAYLGRVIAYYEKTAEAYEEPEDFSNRSEEDELSRAYMLFQSLTPEQQQTVISDLRRSGEGYLAAIERGEMTVEEMEGLDPALFIDAAEFVETGVPPERLVNFIENEW